MAEGFTVVTRYFNFSQPSQILIISCIITLWVTLQMPIHFWGQKVKGQGHILPLKKKL